MTPILSHGIILEDTIKDDVNFKVIFLWITDLKIKYNR